MVFMIRPFAATALPFENDPLVQTSGSKRMARGPLSHGHAIASTRTDIGSFAGPSLLQSSKSLQDLINRILDQ